MAKALKTAAIVVGVAALAVVTGGAAAGLGLSLATTFVVGGAYVSAGALALGAAALSVGSALLTKKPSVTSAQTDRLFANVTPRTFRKTPLGSTALPVDVRYEEWSGKDQEYCDWIVEHASCAIEAVDEIWFDTEMAWSATTGPVGKYRGYFSIPNLILEGTTANAFSFGAGKWNAATARLVGCAYARWRFKVTGNSKKAESPFASDLPSRITVIGRGAKLYDPRRDSTVPGGSGPMRADDQSTWRFTADDGVVIGDNLPLQILRVVLGWRIRNPVTGAMLLATGSGVPPRRLRLPSWITSANIADELVNRSAGGQEPRYHGAAVVSEGDDTKQALDMLCAGCCGRFRDTQGRLALDIAHNDLAAIATDEGLLDDDVIGGFTWDPDPGFDGIPNVIRGQYVDATTGSLYQLIDYPEVRIPSPDGVDRVMTADLGAVESPSQAQRIIKQILQRKLFTRKFTAPFDIRAWKYPVGSVLPFTFAPLGFERVPFRVEAQELGQDGVCNMTLSFEHAAIYAWDKDDAAPVIAADPIVYDASKNPLILAIADAGETAEWEYVGNRNGKKPQDNATWGAPDGTEVGGRPVVDVLAGLDINTAGLLAEALRQDDLLQVFDARTLVDGQAVGMTFKTFRNEQITANSAINSQLILMGAKNAAGTAWNINLDTVMVAEGKSLGQAFQEIGVKSAELSADVLFLRQALIDSNGGTAKFVLAATVTAGGRKVITGIYGTANGDEGSLAFAADNFLFCRLDGPEQIRLLSYSLDRNRWEFSVDVYVRRLAADIIEANHIKSGQITGTRSQSFADRAIDADEATLAQITNIKIGDDVDGKGVLFVNFSQDGTGAADTAMRVRTYVDVGSGWVLVRNTLQGIRVTGQGDARWSLPVSFVVPLLSSSGTLAVKVTAQGAQINGGGNTSGSYARDIVLTVFSGAR